MAFSEFEQDKNTNIYNILYMCTRDLISYPQKSDIIPNLY